MAQQKSWFRRNLKGLLIIATAIFLVFYASVFAWVWADRNYKNNFWSDFFTYSGVVVLVALLGGWAYLWASDRRENTGK